MKSLKRHYSIIKGLAISIFSIAILISDNLTTCAAFDNSATSYHSLLTPAQSQVYEQVYEHAMNSDTSLFRIATPVSEGELEIIMNCFFNDNPEIFWVNTAYRYAVDSSNEVHKLQLRYYISAADLPQAKIFYESQINSIVSGANNIADSTLKEQYIHDRICEMNSYNSNSSLNQSAYSALIGGSSVCAGYSRAFQAACIRAGIPCYYITGESLGQTHAWNVVNLNGNLYSVDLTWDDSLTETYGQSSYYYFNKNDREFAIDHVTSPLSLDFLNTLSNNH
jgi:hypothetical protein